MRSIKVSNLKLFTPACLPLKSHLDANIWSRHETQPSTFRLRGIRENHLFGSNNSQQAKSMEECPTPICIGLFLVYVNWTVLSICKNIGLFIVYVNWQDLNNPRGWGGQGVLARCQSLNTETFVSSNPRMKLLSDFTYKSEFLFPPLKAEVPFS